MPRVITVSAANSTVSVSPSVITNDGLDSATITVRVVDTNGNPVQGLRAASIVLSATGTGNTLTQPTGVTDKDGVITGAIVSTNIAVKTISATVCGLALTDTATVDVGGTVDLLFASAFDAATGNDTTAFTDGGKWTGVTGTNANCAVIANPGTLDFPVAMDNLLHIVTDWNGSGSSAKIPFLTAGLPALSVGTSRFYRWYFRAAVPASLSTWGGPHPIQDGPSAGDFNWELETRRGSTGSVWSPFWTLAANAFPNNRWAALDALNVDETYRFELQFYRTGTTTYQLHAKVFDAAGVQVLGDADFINAAGTGSTSLADNPTLTISNADRLRDFQCGTNGAFQGTVAGDHPVTFCYQGGFAISDSDWIGAYVDGEAP